MRFFSIRVKKRDSYIHVDVKALRVRTNQQGAIESAKVISSSVDKVLEEVFDRLLPRVLKFYEGFPSFIGHLVNSYPSRGRVSQTLNYSGFLKPSNLVINGARARL